MSINSEITRLQNAKNAIQTSIQNKGQIIPVGTKLDGFSTYIDQITGGGDITVQSKTVTPTSATQIVAPDYGYNALSSVTVTGDANLVSPNIRKDTTIFGVTGTLEEGSTVLQSKSVTPTASTQTINPDSGYDGLSSVTVSGDNNLVAKNIKKNTTIFGVTGTYGSGLDITGVGQEVTIETATPVSVGDKFEGEPIEGAARQVVSSGNGASFTGMSGDLDVGITSQTLNANTVYYTIHFKNSQGTYDARDFAFDTTGLQSFLTLAGISSFSLSTVYVNEDGSMALGVYETGSGINTLTFLMIIAIDKENKTARIRTDNKYALYIVYTETDYSNWKKYDAMLGSMYGSFLGKNYFFTCFKIQGTKTSDSSTKTNFFYPIYYISPSSLTLSFVKNINIPGYSYQSDGLKVNSHIWINNNTFLVGSGLASSNEAKRIAKISKYSISRNNCTGTGAVWVENISTLGSNYRLTHVGFSPNGNYITYHHAYQTRTAYDSASDFTYIYAFNAETMTIGSTVRAISFARTNGQGNTCYVTNDGAFLVMQDKVYNVITGATVSGNMGSVKENTYINGYSWSNGGSTYTITPTNSTTAEYRISRFVGNYTNSGRVYGICTENLAAGLDGNAQLLFRTPAASE